MGKVRVLILVSVLALPAFSLAVDLSRCGPLFIQTWRRLLRVEQPPKAHGQVDKAWKQSFSDHVIKEFWTYLTQKTYEQAAAGPRTRAPYLGSAEAIHLTFEVLDEKIRKTAFLRLASLLLDHELLPPEQEALYTAAEVGDLIKVLSLHSRSFDLSLLEVKGLLISILDRWETAQSLDTNHQLSEAIENTSSGEDEGVPGWLKVLPWGKQKLRLKDVHDTAQLKVATTRTFKFHFKNHFRTLLPSAKLTEADLEAIFHNTFSGSVMSGDDFVSIIRTLVFSADLYNGRIYHSGTSAINAELQFFANLLRQASMRVELSPVNVDQLELLLRRFALGLMLARDFSQTRKRTVSTELVRKLSDYLLGSKLDLDAERDLPALDRYLRPIQSKKSTELPQELDRAIATLFARHWGLPKKP